MELRTGEVTLGTKPGVMLAQVDVADSVDRAGLTLLEMTPPGEHDLAKLPEGETAVDPVCRMKVRIEGAALKLDHGGTTHYFCNDYCLTRFKQEPAKFGE